MGEEDVVYTGNQDYGNKNINKKCYVLSIRLYTNGDYVCNYENFKEEYCCGYSYSKVFLNLDEAIFQSIKIIKNISKTTTSIRRHVNEILKDFFSDALLQFSLFCPTEEIEIYSYLNNDYEGTEIRFFESEIN